MNPNTIQIRWSAAIPCRGADASPIPGRGGVYELLMNDATGSERMYVGETDDLRRAFVAHIAGSKGHEDIRRGMQEQEASFRYWESDSKVQRLEVVSALIDLHCYEYGYEDIEPIGYIELEETE